MIEPNSKKTRIDAQRQIATDMLLDAFLLIHEAEMNHDRGSLDASLKKLRSAQLFMKDWNLKRPNSVLKHLTIVVENRFQRVERMLNKEKKENDLQI